MGRLLRPRSRPKPRRLTRLKLGQTTPRGQCDDRSFRVNVSRLTLALSALFAAYSALIETRRFVVRRFEVELAHLPPSAEGMRIAHISDLHGSAIVGPRLIRRAVEMCNEEQPDLVAVTGDFVSRRGSYFPLSGLRQRALPVHVYAQRTCDELAHLRAPLGVYGVLGNHDHAEHLLQSAGKVGTDVQWLEEMLGRAGVQMLTNRATRMRGLAVAGVDDWRSGQPALQSALAGIELDEALLLLSHNPRVLWLARDRPALILSGHTHAGQIRVPGAAPLVLPADMKGERWTEGSYRMGRAQMYVNAGVGSVSLPLRFDCPPEITLYTLRTVTSRNAL